MPNKNNPISQKYKELFHLADDVDDTIHAILGEFNKRDIKLFNLPAYQRIFLFVITRSIKTYSSIRLLCQEGFGQDVATLLRSLMENLVTVRFILHDRKFADEKAARFVAYKWVIFKRHLPEQERNIRKASNEERLEFFKKRDNVLKQVNDFKKKFNITSDRALMTWSGKTVRDMAREVDRKLLNEYETTFRLCSRFSHPSILGDNEYLVQDDKNITFSPLPSEIGITVNLKNAIFYILNFLFIIDDFFNFKYKDRLKDLEKRGHDIFKLNLYKDPISIQQAPPKRSNSIRESRITFKVKPEK